MLGVYYVWGFRDIVMSKIIGFYLRRVYILVGGDNI